MGRREGSGPLIRRVAAVAAPLAYRSRGEMIGGCRTHLGGQTVSDIRLRWMMWAMQLILMMMMMMMGIHFPVLQVVGMHTTSMDGRHRGLATAR